MIGSVNKATPHPTLPSPSTLPRRLAHRVTGVALLLGAATLLLLAPRAGQAQQGATEVDQPRAPRAAASRPLRSAPRKDISAELSAAQARIDAQDWLGAVTELTRAKSRDPANLEVLNLLGFCQRRAGDYDGAVVTFKNLLRQAPQLRSAHEQIGKTYLLLAQPEDAQLHLQQLQQLCGTDCVESRELDTAIRTYLR
jgi:Flp pilus assembly protein TadD